MSKAQTDNDPKGIYGKVALRRHSLSAIKSNEVRVLDCFAGHGRVWKTVAANEPSRVIRVVGIDKRTDVRRPLLHGDNRKFLLTMDLNRFDIIDLDAYGNPIEQVLILLARQYQGIVHCTFIQSFLRQLPFQMLTDLGYTRRMIEQCPTLIARHGFVKVCKWLQIKGLRDILYIQVGANKTYLYSNFGGISQ